MLHAIAFDRPKRSPNRPKIRPPLAAPNRNAQVNHANQLVTIDFIPSHSVFSAGYIVGLAEFFFGTCLMSF